MKYSTAEVSTKVPKKSGVSLAWLVFLLGALASFAPLSIDMYLPALPNITVDLQTSTSLVQLSLTACLLGIALGQILAGPISDVYGRRGPLLIGVGIYIISSLLCVVSSTIWMFVSMRFLQGIAGAAGIVVSRAVVRDLYSGAEMTKFFSLLMLVNGVAPILAPILGGQVLTFTDWRGVFLILSGVGLFMLLAVFFGLKESLPTSLRSKGGLTNTFRTFRSLLGNRKFMGYALGQGFVMAAMFAYIAGSPFILQDIYGVSPQLFSVFFAINGLGIIIAGQITGSLAGKVQETKLLIIGLSLALFGGLALLFLIIMKASLYAILLPLFLVVSSVGIVNTSSFSLAMEDQAKSAGSAAALIGLLSFIFGGFMAPLVGISGSHTALPMGIIIAVAEIAAVLSYVFLVKES